MMFIMVFSKEDKKKLESKGYKCLYEKKNMNQEYSYVFMDNPNLKFEKDIKVVRTNKMYF